VSLYLLPYPASVLIARRNARLAKPYREIQPRRASFMIRFLTEGVR
jgi:hypothetical protein